MTRFSRRFSQSCSVATVAAVALTIGVAGIGSSAMAQSRGPAEYPPASYAGSQYVDSKGCVFVRAGVNGNVTWVPRVARNRQAVCGFQPTQVQGATAAPTARPPVTVITAAEPETQAAPAAGPAQTAAAPQAQPAVPAPVRRPAAGVAGPSVAPVAVQPVPRVRAPAAPVVEARPRILPAPAAPVVSPVLAPQVATPCDGLSATGRTYMGYGGTQGLRCGPQSDYASNYASGAPRFMVPGAAPAMTAPQAPQAAAPASGPKVFAVPTRDVKRVVTARTTSDHQIDPDARVMPKHVYENKQLTQQGIAVPKGYRKIWEDDRLNPRRAEQTLSGKRKMEMVWTNTVPRRLVPVEVAPAKPVARAASVSSRSAPQPAAPAGRYIQVGSFRTPGNAQAVAQTLANKSGQRVQLRQSGTARVVMMGPFTNDRDLGRALAIARQAGFADAFPRH